MEFSNNWFNNSELKLNIYNYLNPNNINKILEIGVYEGASSCYFSDNFLNKEGSLLVCVDPFNTMDTTSPVTQDTFLIFKNNISKSKNWKKVLLSKLYSKDFFKKNKNTFDFIYIDGSHIPNDIKSDFEESLKIINNKGIIYCDDYLGGNNYEIKQVYDELYDKYKDKLTIVHKGYQIAFQVKN